MKASVTILMTICFTLLLTGGAFCNVNFQIPRNTHQLSIESLTRIHLIRNDHVSSATVQPIVIVKNERGEEVLVLKVDPVELNKPMLNLNQHGFSVVRMSSAYSEFISMHNSLPAGDYKICLMVECLDGNCRGIDEKATHDCHSVRVRGFLDIALNFPPNMTSINNTRPVFNWSIIGQREGISYVIEVFELEDFNSQVGSSKPLILLENLEFPRASFNEYNRSFEVGETYAWRVSAFRGSMKVANSDVWYFEISDSEDVTETSNNSYRVLANEPNSGAYDASKGSVYFMLPERYSVEQPPEIKIINLKEDITYEPDINSYKLYRPESSEIPEFLVQKGNNMFHLDLEHFKLSQGLYQLVVENTKGNEFFLMFKY